MNLIVNCGSADFEKAEGILNGNRYASGEEKLLWRSHGCLFLSSDQTS